MSSIRLASRPPLLVPIRELWAADDAKRMTENLRRALASYLASLRDDRRALLDQFEIVDMARKVVGVGSVGTRCFVVLLRGKGRTTCCSSRSSRPRRQCSSPPGPSGYATTGTGW